MQHGLIASFEIFLLVQPISIYLLIALMKEWVSHLFKCDYDRIERVGQICCKEDHRDDIMIYLLCFKLQI